MTPTDRKKWIGALTHVAAVALGLSAICVITVMGLGRPDPSISLYGERMLARFITTLALVPALLAFAGLSVVPYWRLAASYGTRTLVWFHVLEVMLATGLTIAAVWVVGNDWEFLM